jgi:hypothetical protein
MEYDADKVQDEFMVPAVEILLERMESKKNLVSR